MRIARNPRSDPAVQASTTLGRGCGGGARVKKSLNLLGRSLGPSLFFRALHQSKRGKEGILIARKDPAQPEPDALHSSASAFEVRHQDAGSSERARAGDRRDEEQPGESESAGETAQAAVTGGFTRRCGKRAPADKRPCMLPFGHGGRHAWEPANAGG